MQFLAENHELEQIYEKSAGAMYGLAFIHTSVSQNAVSIINSTMLETATNQKAFETAQSGTAGTLQILHQFCMDYYRKKARKKIKAEALKKSSLPFAVTGCLIDILHLPPAVKTPLFLRDYCGMQTAEIAKTAALSENRTRRLLEKADTALHKNYDRDTVRSTIKSIAINRQSQQRIIDKVMLLLSEKGILGKLQAKRVKRGLDAAIPYIAGFVILFCIFCVCAVQFGWLGQPYSQSEPFDDLPAASLSPNDPIYKLEDYSYPAHAESQPALAYSDVTIYVPGDTGLTAYTVTNMPNDAAALVTQMVVLGGLPERTSLLSVTFENGETDMDESSHSGAGLLQVALSEEAYTYFKETGDTTLLRAMTRTFEAYYGKLEVISITGGGKELSAGGETASAFLGDTTETDKAQRTAYRE